MILHIETPAPQGLKGNDYVISVYFINAERWIMEWQMDRRGQAVCASAFN